MSDSLRPPWKYEDPLCAEVGTEIFFGRDQDEPLKGALPQDMYKDAKKICESCNHSAECAEWGIKYESHGVWGGLSPADRRNFRRGVTRLPFSVKR